MLVLAPWVVVPGAVVVAWLTADLRWVAAGAVVGACAGSMLTLLVARARARQVAGLEQLARTLLSEGPEDSARVREVVADELDSLELAVRELGRLQAAQLKELAKKTRNLESLIDSLAEPVLVTDDRDDVLLCNRAAERMLGIPHGTLLGRNVRELFTRQEVLRMHAAAHAGQPGFGQVPMMTLTGPRTFQVSAAPLPPAWGEGVFGVVLVLRDVTELAQAVQFRTDFVANASHELRTPVAAIKAATETLIDGGKDEPALRDRLLTMITNHCQRLEDMTRDLMDLSRLETPDMPVRPARVDWEEMEAVLHESFEQILAQRSLRLEISWASELMTRACLSDPKLLLLIVRNLVDNATKFGREGTTIQVRGRLLSHPPGGAESAGEGEPAGAANGAADPKRRATGLAASETHWLRLDVSDEGIGIPIEQQERVFERFYQVDGARTGTGGSTAPGRPQRRGTGLGLAIVKHAVKALEGRVGIESVWQKGTTVWFEIPLLPEPAPEAEPAGEPEGEPAV